jgi:hypothetical protein
VSRPTRGCASRFPVRGCHPLRPAFPDASGTKLAHHWPGPRSLATTSGVSSALLSQSAVLMSFPPATEMFQFAGFASHAYGFSMGYPFGWVAPFGDPGINDRSHLPRAFRSVPRPSSPLSAKASTRCPSFALERHTQRQGSSPAKRLGVSPRATGESDSFRRKPGYRKQSSDIGDQNRRCDKLSFSEDTSRYPTARKGRRGRSRRLQANACRARRSSASPDTATVTQLASSQLSINNRRSLPGTGTLQAGSGSSRRVLAAPGAGAFRGLLRKPLSAR